MSSRPPEPDSAAPLAAPPTDPSSSSVTAALFDSHRVLALLCDAAGRVTRINAAVQRSLGYTLADLQPAAGHPRVLPPPEGAGATHECVQEVLTRAGQCRTIAWESRPLAGTAEGGTLWLGVELPAGAPAPATAATPARPAVGATDDAPPRAAETLRWREEVFAGIVSCAADGIVLLDRQTKRFVEFNTAAHEGLGYSREEFAALTLADILAEEPSEEIRAACTEATTLPRPPFENRHRHRDGTLREVRVTARPLQLRDQLYVVAVWTDITELKRSQSHFQEGMRLRREAEKIARIGAWKVSPQSDFLYWTEGVYEILEAPTDYRPGLAEGLAFYDAESLPLVRASLERALLDGTPFTIEVGLTTRTGRHLWTEIRGLGRLTDGQQAYVIGTFQDITERRAAKEELTANNEELARALRELDRSRTMLQLVIESIPVRVFWKDTQLRYLGCNRLFARDAGAETPADLVGQDDFALAWRDQAEQYRADDWQVISSGQAKSNILEPQDSASGSRIWLATSKVPLRDAGGEIIGVLGVYEDITERRRAEESLRENERRLATLFANLPGMAYRCQNERAWPMVFVSEGATALTGYPIAELLANRPAYGELIIPADRQQVWDNVQAGLAVRQPFELSYQIETASGRLAWVWERGRGVFADDGSLLFLEGFVIDVTARKTAEDALREERQRLASIITGANVGTWEWNIQTGQTNFNERWAGILGYTLAELAPISIETWIRLVHPSDLQESDDRLQRHFRGELEYYECAARMRHKDGSWIWVLDRGKVTSRSPDGRPLLMQGTHTDITGRMQAEEAVRQSEERYRTLIETSADWIWEVDAEGRFTYSSPQVQDVLGYSPAEVIGQTPFHFMPDDEARRVRAVFQDLAAARQSFSGLENLNRHRSGHHVLLETSGVPILAPDGRWLGYRGTDRDITARRNAEQTLRLHGAALEAAANAIVITNPAGTIEWANPAFSELSGWSIAEARGRNFRDLVKSGEHEPEFYRQMWATISSGQVWRGRIVNRRKDGSRRTEDMTITPLLGPAGEISHYIAIKQDITEQKTLEAQLLQSQRMEAIGTLAGGIAHDLNNILSPMLMVSTMLEEKLADANDREILTMLQHEARRGADIIKQLLTFSRGLAGERTVIQPRHILRELIAMMRETFPREIDLQQFLPGNLMTVLADPTQLHQVMLNLCVNARDAMPDGGHLVIRASNVIVAAGDPGLPAHARPGPYVCLEVSDTGQGIPPDIQHRIFDPFFTTKPVGKGTGLGLSTVLGIVQNHGGFVTFASIAGRGTQFKVHLPGQDAPEAAAPAAPAEPVRASEGELILVVDDERNVRETIRMMLERNGYRVLVATHGEDALALYFQNRRHIHLVLTDLMMPVMNGVVLIRTLRSLDPALPIVASSGLGDITHRQELATLGVSEILMKPTDPPALLGLIRRRLTRSSAGG